jgi:integrase
MPGHACGGGLANIANGRVRDILSQERREATARRPHPRRVRVAEHVYQHVDSRTGKPVAGKYEFSYRDATGRQVWQTANGETKADARSERADLVSRMRRGQRVERTTLTVSQVAQLWVERRAGRRDAGLRRRASGTSGLCADTSTPPLTLAHSQSEAASCATLSMDRVAAWSQANERALAPTSARIAPNALNQVCRFAVRRGWLAENPVAKLEAAEKPRWTPQKVAILEGEQLARFLAHAEAHRPVFEFLAYTGLRIGEALGLTWADIDFDAGLIRVHRQLNRHRQHAPLKTPAGRREVVLAPGVAKLLRERWLATQYKAQDDLVFANGVGRGLDYREVGNSFRATVTRRDHRQRAALPALPAPRLRLAADRQRPKRRLRLPPARTRQPHRHARHLRAPIRARRPRPRREGGARGELRGDGGKLRTVS